MREGWTYKKLGEVAQSDLGKTLNSSKDKGFLYPYLCAVNVLWDNIDTSTLKETRFEETEFERYSVKKGDLLICEGGDIGRAAIWNKEEPILYQNALHRVRFNGEVFPRFCLLYLRFLKENGVLDGRYGKGVTIKHLVKSALLSIPIPVPPLSEQQRIVSELDLLSSIIEKKKTQLKEYDQLAQSIFYDMFGDPVTNEKGWEVKKLGEVCEKITDGTHNSPINTERGDFMYITAKNIKKDGIILDNITYVSADVHKSIYERCNPQYGDVLYIKDGITTGIATINTLREEFSLLSSVALLKPKGCMINYYLKAVLNMPSQYASIRKKMGGAAITRLTIAKINEINIPLPPLSLQQSFASKIESIERQKTLIQQSIKEVQMLFDSRMDYWFS